MQCFRSFSAPYEFNNKDSKKITSGTQNGKRLLKYLEAFESEFDVRIDRLDEVYGNWFHGSHPGRRTGHFRIARELDLSAEKALTS